jgi:GAF domain-containing protein
MENREGEKTDESAPRSEVPSGDVPNTDPAVETLHTATANLNRYKRSVQKVVLSAQAKAEQLLQDATNRMGAKSATLYLPDKWQPGSLRLAAMFGVKFCEPMFGFMFPSSSMLYPDGSNHPSDDEEFRVFSDPIFYNDLATSDADPSPIVSRDEIERSRFGYLFGNFAQREGVKTCIRFRSRRAQGDSLLLWVNYAVPHAVSDQDKKIVHQLRDHLERLVPSLDKEAGASTTPWVTNSIHILNCMADLTPMGESLESRLGRILQGVTRAFDLKPDEVANVLLFKPQTQTLDIAQHIGPGEEAAKAVSVDIRKLNEIVTWVAVMRRAIVITDLKCSKFGELHSCGLSQAASQLAVPLISGDELLGVLNLESPRPGRFPPESVRPLWYSANQAAMACRLVQQTEWTQRLMEIAYEATSGVVAISSQNSANDTAHSKLDQFANLAREMLGATHCDIWQFSRHRSQFERIGATYDEQKEPPRSNNGWSQFVHRSGNAVWICGIQSETAFSVKFWNRHKLCWDPTSSELPPTTVNRNLVNLNIACEIGIPLMSHGTCVGVAWVKYKTERPPPTQKLMALAAGFAAEGGLIIDLYNRYHEAQQEQRELEKFTEKILPCGAFNFPGIECFVIRKSCGKLGGDFHHIYEHRPAEGRDSEGAQVNFFIGDAEGHGLKAGLNMLPIITTFRVVHKDSESTKHTLRRLLPIAAQGGHSATALYFVVRPSEKGPLLFASSSGHPPVMIYRNDGTVEMLPREWGTNAMLGDIPLALAQLPLAEEWLLLRNGDVLVAMTDGILEAGQRTDPPSPLGRKGLNAVVFQNMSTSAENIAAAIERIARKCDEGDLRDDATVMVLKIQHPPC